MNDDFDDDDDDDDKGMVVAVLSSSLLVFPSTIYSSIYIAIYIEYKRPMFLGIGHETVPVRDISSLLQWIDIFMVRMRSTNRT